MDNEQVKAFLRERITYSGTTDARKWIDYLRSRVRMQADIHFLDANLIAQCFVNRCSELEHELSKWVD